MAISGVQVVGVEAAIARFAALGAASDRAMDAAELAGGETVLERAEAQVPVATGTLRDSLHVTTDPEGGVLVGSEVDYAVYVEFGTADAPAQPFLRPAIDSAEDEVTREAQLALEAAIRAVGGL